MDSTTNGVTEDRYFTYEQAAKYLGIAPGTVAALVSRGVFKGIKARHLGRVGSGSYLNREQLDYYLANRGHGVTGERLPDELLPPEFATPSSTVAINRLIAVVKSPGVVQDEELRQTINAMDKGMAEELIRLNNTHERYISEVSALLKARFDAITNMVRRQSEYDATPQVSAPAQ